MAASTLPTLCLELIFSHLNLEERLLCLETCRSWFVVLRRMLLKETSIMISDTRTGRHVLRTRFVFGDALSCAERVPAGFVCLPNLHTLDIADLSSPLKEQVARSLGHVTRLRMKCLRVGFFGGVRLEHFATMIKAVPQLEDFGGHSGEMASPNRYVRCLLSFCLHLRTLSLAGSRQVVAPAFQSMQQELVDVNLYGCRALDDDVIQHLLLSSGRSLRHLKLSYTFPLSHTAVYLLAFFHHLQSLHLSESIPTPCGIAAASPTEFSYLCALRHIQDLRFHHNNCVHDTDLRRITRRCQHLTSVRILSSPAGHLTREGLQVLVQVRTLVSLHLGPGLPVTDTHLTSLAALPSLKKLNLCHCPRSNVTLGGLMALAVGCNSLHYFYLGTSIRLRQNEHELVSVLRAFQACAVRSGNLVVKIHDNQRGNMRTWKQTMVATHSTDKFQLILTPVVSRGR